MMKSNMNISAVLKAKTIASPIAVLSHSVSNWVAALLTVVVFFLLVNLGLWQLGRGEAKQLLEQQLETRAIQTHIPLSELTDYSVPVTGLKVSAAFNTSDNPLIYLDNQTHNGQAGYLVYQIVKPHNHNDHLLIELGFIPTGHDRSVLPVTPKTLQQERLTGRLYARSLNKLSSDLMPETIKHLRIQNLNFKQLETKLMVSLLPFALQPDQVEDWPLPQPWKPIPMASSKHFAYSVQWFAMATVWLLLMLTIFYKKLRAINRDIS